MSVGQIQRAKIQKEIPIDEFLIDIKTDDREFLIRICRVKKGISDQNLVVLKRIFQGGIIE